MRSHLIRLTGLLLLAGCTQDAPRDNIFDSESTLYKYSGSITGTVTSIYPPVQPLDSVRVELSPANRIGFSGPNGKFVLERLAPGGYHLRLSREFYVTREESLRVEAQAEVEIVVALNGQPQIDSVSLVTRHIAHWWPIEHEYVLEVDVFVSDRDGALDIEAVFMTVPALGFSALLTERSQTGVFSGVYYDSDFAPGGFAELPGRDIVFQAGDQAEALSAPLSRPVSRIISSTPTTLSPGNQAVVSTLPVFRWSSFDVGFNITYAVDIFRLNESGIPLYITGSEELSAATFEWQAADPLPAARYYWTLTATDGFGNSSVSKEATFIVQ